jgi:hypothetical protein
MSARWNTKGGAKFSTIAFARVGIPGERSTQTTACPPRPEGRALLLCRSHDRATVSAPKAMTRENSVDQLDLTPVILA